MFHIGRTNPSPVFKAYRTFYAGKKYSAIYFANNVLPSVPLKAQLLAKEDRSAIEMPEAAFATV